MIEVKNMFIYISFIFHMIVRVAIFHVIVRVAIFHVIVRVVDHY